MASYGFCSVLETQESTSAEKGPVGISVYSLILSLEIIVSGLKRTKFVFWKPVYIFSSPKIAKNTMWKQAKKSGLVI